MLNWIGNLARKEPIRCLQLANAVIILAIVFGAKLTAEQQAAVIGVVTIVLGVGGGEAARMAVTPNASLTGGQAAEARRLSDAKQAVADAAIKAADDPKTGL